MRIIIVGGGEVGYALARELSRDNSISVVDQDPDVAQRFKVLDVGFLTGSGTHADTRRTTLQHITSPILSFKRSIGLEPTAAPSEHSIHSSEGS